MICRCMILSLVLTIGTEGPSCPWRTSELEGSKANLIPFYLSHPVPWLGDAKPFRSSLFESGFSPPSAPRFLIRQDSCHPWWTSTVGWPRGRAYAFSIQSLTHP